MVVATAVSLNFTLTKGDQGAYSGTWSGSQRSGVATAIRRPDVAIAGEQMVSVWFASRGYALLRLSNGTLQSVTMYDDKAGLGLTKSEPTAPVVDENGPVTTIITPAGSASPASSAVGSLTDEQLTFSFNSGGATVPGTLTVIGTAVQGEVDRNGVPVSVLGRVGRHADVELHHPRARPNRWRLFSSDFSIMRLLLRSPEAAPFRADESLLNASENGSKNYDNATQHVYWSRYGVRIIATLSDDQKSGRESSGSRVRQGAYLKMRSKLYAWDADVL